MSVEHEYQFLLKEYEKAWDMIFAIEDRRQSVSQLAIVGATGVWGFLGVIFAKFDFGSNIGITQQLLFVWIPSLLVVAVGIVGLNLVLNVLISERDANLRYRERINQIRGIFLSHSQNPLVATYLARKDLGNLVGSDPQPSGAGRTLPQVLRLLQNVRAAIYATAVTLLLAFCTSLYLQFW